MTSISNTYSHRPDSIYVIEFISGKIFWSDLRGQDRSWLTLARREDKVGTGTELEGNNDHTLNPARKCSLKNLPVAPCLSYEYV